MTRTSQLPVGELLLHLGGRALVLCTLALALTPMSGWALHVPGHIPPTGTCRDCSVCPDSPLCTGKTGGSNVPRDSKTKAPGDTKAKAPGDTKAKAPDDECVKRLKNECRAVCASEDAKRREQNKRFWGYIYSEANMLAKFNACNARCDSITGSGQC